MVQVTSFTYTKADSSVSQRVVVPFVQPSRFISGVDITELDQEAQGAYIAELAAIKEEYLSKLSELETKHDLRNRYRQFDQSRITNQHTEEI
jgi:hypothetical protein